MNYGVDLINSWAEKFAYRVMKIAGVKQETLDNYVKAIVKRDQEQDAADKTLSKSLDIAEILKLVIIAGILFLVFKILKAYKSK